MSEPRFDVEDVFDEDYLYFYEGALSDERTDKDVELLWRLLDLEPGLDVLDLACGHGRIANRRAARGCRLTGLDRTPLFLERGRRDAGERGVDVEYVHGDMRSLPWRGRFDRILCWFTSFGYFGDDENKAVLREAARALRPGGAFAVELNQRDELVGRLLPAVVTERDGDFLIDRGALDVLSGRFETERVVIRGGSVRRMHFSVRMLAFTELRDWLLEAGFREVHGYGPDGEPLTLESRRMVAVARV